MLREESVVILHKLIVVGEGSVALKRLVEICHDLAVVVFGEELILIVVELHNILIHLKIVIESHFILGQYRHLGNACIVCHKLLEKLVCLRRVSYEEGLVYVEVLRIVLSEGVSLGSLGSLFACLSCLRRLGGVSNLDRLSYLFCLACLSRLSKLCRLLCGAHILILLCGILSAFRDSVAVRRSSVCAFRRSLSRSRACSCRKNLLPLRIGYSSLIACISCREYLSDIFGESNAGDHDRCAAVNGINEVVEYHIGLRTRKVAPKREVDIIVINSTGCLLVILLRHIGVAHSLTALICLGINAEKRSLYVKAFLEVYNGRFAVESLLIVSCDLFVGVKLLLIGVNTLEISSDLALGSIAAFKENYSRARLHLGKIGIHSSAHCFLDRGEGGSTERKSYIALGGSRLAGFAFIASVVCKGIFCDNLFGQFSHGERGLFIGSHRVVDKALGERFELIACQSVPIINVHIVSVNERTGLLEVVSRILRVGRVNASAEVVYIACKKLALGIHAIPEKNSGYLAVIGSLLLAEYLFLSDKSLLEEIGSVKITLEVGLGHSKGSNRRGAFAFGHSFGFFRRIFAINSAIGFRARNIFIVFGR